MRASMPLKNAFEAVDGVKDMIGSDRYVSRMDTFNERVTRKAGPTRSHMCAPREFRKWTASQSTLLANNEAWI